MKRAWLALPFPFCVVAFLACGDTVEVGGPQSSKDDGGCPSTAQCVPNDGGVADAAVTSVTGVVSCPYGEQADAAVTQTYDKECKTASDCAIGKHLHDPCGTYAFLGTRTSENARFARDGGVCGNEASDAQTLCESPPGPPLADDGTVSGFSDGHDIIVACASGRCTTTAPFACATAVCRDGSDYCRGATAAAPLPDGGTPTAAYVCQPLPSTCVASPTCACLRASSICGAATLVNCTEHGGRVTLVCS